MTLPRTRHDPATSCLDALSSALGAQERWTSEQLAVLLHSVDPDALRVWATFSDGGYQRLHLWSDERAEVRLLCWRPGQSSSLHAHGASACAFRVLQGSVTETPLAGSPVRHVAGDVAATPTDAVHQVANDGPIPAVTLHVYAPPLPVDQPSTEEGLRVAIVGGGFSGAALAVHLLRSGDPRLRLTLVEPRGELGRGVAYDAEPGLLLNVPAGRMSLDPAEPLDFARFAGVAPEALAPRSRYGDYVGARLREALSAPGRLRVARTTAVAAERAGGAWRLALADGRSVVADELVLATGLGAPSLPGPWLALEGHARLVTNPTAPGALRRIGPDDAVLVLGTGLTALDAVSVLARGGHRAPVHAVSRNGRWPAPHLPGVVWSGAPFPLAREDAPRTAAGLARWLRRHVDAAVAVGLPWQVGFDAVRPHVPALWAGLDEAQRRRFLGRFRSAWEVLRHRAPTALVAEREAMTAAGRLRTHRGGASLVAAEPQGVVVEVGGEVRRFDHVVACAGWGADPRRSTDPLWSHLLAEGLAHPDPLGLGVLTDAEGAAVGPDGARTGPWLLGAPLRPARFESTAVPELAGQAAALASALLRSRAGRDR